MWINPLLCLPTYAYTPVDEPPSFVCLSIRTAHRGVTRRTQTSNLKLQEENRAAMRQLKELMSAASNDQSTSSVNDSAQRQTEQVGARARGCA